MLTKRAGHYYSVHGFLLSSCFQNPSGTFNRRLQVRSSELFIAKLDWRSDMYDCCSALDDFGIIAINEVASDP
jgi:hypothetical protein